MTDIVIVATFAFCALIAVTGRMHRDIAKHKKTIQSLSEQLSKEIEDHKKVMRDRDIVQRNANDLSSHFHDIHRTIARTCERDDHLRHVWELTLWQTRNEDVSYTLKHHVVRVLHHLSAERTRLRDEIKTLTNQKERLFELCEELRERYEADCVPAKSPDESNTQEDTHGTEV